MIGVSVTFQYDDDFDHSRVLSIAENARQTFEGMPGLRSKAFTVDDARQRAMNFYVWESADFAKRYFSEELRERVTGLYGVAPTIDFVEIAQVVDNEQTTKRASTAVRYETRMTIDRPISEVFARLADLDGYRTWMRRTGMFRRSGITSDGPLGLGTAYFDATRMGTFRGEVTEYEPPVRLGFRETLRGFGSDLMEARPEYTLEADGDKTIVHHVAEGELFGVMRLMKPMAVLLARSERGRTVEALRRSLESD